MLELFIFWAIVGIMISLVGNKIGPPSLWWVRAMVGMVWPIVLVGMVIALYFGERLNSWRR